MSRVCWPHLARRETVVVEMIADYRTILERSTTLSHWIMRVSVDDHCVEPRSAPDGSASLEHPKEKIRQLYYVMFCFL